MGSQTPAGALLRALPRAELAVLAERFSAEF
jgi:hypothetical protein